MEENKLAIVILNFNNYMQTIECIKNVKEKSNLNYRIVIVDNNSSDGSFEKLTRQKKELDFDLLQTDVNGGFAFGNNVGIDYAISIGSKYICVMNNDITLEKDVFQDLIDFYESHPKSGVIGPAILNEEKVVSFSGAKFNFGTGKATRFFEGSDYSLIAKKKPIKTDYVLGAFMFFSANVFLTIGKIPEEYFLDFEETEWGWKISKNGLNNYCLPYVYVTHAESSTINNITDLGYYFMHRNRILFERRNAKLSHKIIFYPYVLLALFKECVKNRSFKPIVFSFDGITKKNKFEYLKK
ncbi:glycosyltransferase family 2 protein [Pediococcus acidilactici]|uniref:glycosyltransferase family 2 protein n=1 Tax=Pediococcus acidilactici TaxID=1254 RepID=UPI000E5D6C5A|nr:glycosyltransferase family 2 protein [Pediococcus acidilactici]RJF47246.1 glycosyltransferase family 2 protein [Pediococcus acidilactici]